MAVYSQAGGSFRDVSLGCLFASGQTAVAPDPGHACFALCGSPSCILKAGLQTWHNLELRLGVEIIGHGVDLMPIDVAQRLLDRSDDFVDGWFTDRESQDLRARHMRADEIAGRVAAKEATAKALGTGFDHRVSWHDIEVLPSVTGSPTVVLSEGADEVAKELGVERVIVSISHAGGMAMASALALRT